MSEELLPTSIALLERVRVLLRDARHNTLTAVFSMKGLLPPATKRV